MFSLLRPCRCGCTFGCALCVTRRPSQTNPKRYVERITPPPSWTPQESMGRGKKSSQALPDVWEREGKNFKQPNSSFPVSTTTMPSGPPQNHWKAYSLNVWWRWRSATFLSPVVFISLPYLDDYVKELPWRKYADLKKIYFSEHLLEYTAAKKTTVEHSGFSWNSPRTLTGISYESVNLSDD